MGTKTRNRTKIIGAGAVPSRGRTVLVCQVCTVNFSLPNCHAARVGVGKYCSVECQAKERQARKEERRRECESCGKVFYPRWTQIDSGGGKYCCQKCHGAAERLDNGYVIIYVNGKKTKEHRYLMSKVLGRELMPDEIVHHINHDKTDNRICNLQIMTLGEHTTLHHNHRSLLAETLRRLA